MIKDEKYLCCISALIDRVVDERYVGKRILSALDVGILISLRVRPQACTVDFALVDRHLLLSLEASMADISHRSRFIVLCVDIETVMLSRFLVLCVDIETVMLSRFLVLCVDIETVMLS